jgi:hypothetical protein
MMPIPLLMDEVEEVGRGGKRQTRGFPTRASDASVFARGA